MRVTQRQVPLVIGRGGATIKQLQADSGAIINVDKEDSVLRIRGSKQAVELATSLVQKLLSPPQQHAQPPAAPMPPPGLIPAPPGLSN
mmetsp:Transcript_39145/g.86053  ORF Transcript_39145/g.86053 Transcript_39145/m.86053 type:complete len:88 (-) Transcript_39145:293-556(-)